MMQNELLIKKCLEKVEHNLNWIDSHQWQQKHFETLTELIYDKTKVSLSPLTLKRLWGKVKYESSPSVTTLDALARFLEYDDWIDFQCSHKANRNSVKVNTLINKGVMRWLGFVIGGIILSITAVKLVAYISPKDYSSFEFSVQKMASGLPNTVYFKYNVKKTDADSVTIQQTWNPQLHHLVDRDKTDFSCVYYYPGYYNAKLVLDSTIVSQQDVHITSDGWLGVLHKDPIPFYLHTAALLKDTKLAITKAQLIDAGFDLNGEIPLTTLNLIQRFDSIPGRNFKLQASFKQTFAQGEAICQKSGLIILCTNGYFYIPQAIKGCVNELTMHIPEKTFKAEDTDLSHLGIEKHARVDLSLSVFDGVLNLKINENSTFVDSLTTDPGLVVGVKFGFHGAGELSDFNIQSGDYCYTMLDFIP